MIGLKRGTVKLNSNSSGWSRAFAAEKNRILKASRGIILNIQHIGSTAVKGLLAKPIIDMTAGVHSMHEAKKLIEPLASLGYRFYKKFGAQILFAKGPDEKRTHYLHVMKYNGHKWRRDLRFRDYLRTHPARLKQYAQLKRKLASLYPKEREKYTAGKDEFIKQTIEFARAEARSIKNMKTRKTAG